MYDGILQTDIVVWFGITEPEWDDEDWEEGEEESSLRVVKNRRRESWSFSNPKIGGDFHSRS